LAEPQHFSLLIFWEFVGLDTVVAKFEVTLPTLFDCAVDEKFVAAVSSAFRFRA
jgi:hypothetical protein